MGWGKGTETKSVEKLTLDYSGAALDSHEMDVRELAPALLSLSDAFDIAGGAIMPGAQMTLKATATEQGSFLIDLTIAASYVVSAAQAALVSDPVTATLNAASVVKLFMDGAKAIKALAKRGKPRKSESGGGIDIVEPDGMTVHVSENAMRLTQQKSFVIAVQKVFAPAGKPGVSKVVISSESRETVSATHEEAGLVAAYDPDADAAETCLDVSESDMVVQPVSVNYLPGKTWRVTDGSNTYSVVLADQEFAARVEAGLRIGSHDVLKVRMRTEVWQDRKTGKLKPRYTALKVEYKPYEPSEQGEFGF